METLLLDAWRRAFEVSLFGHIAVTQALLPALLASSGGLVNIGSVNGHIALPAVGAYSAAKFALEAVSDSLRREVAPLGVQVVVEPGVVRTALLSSGTAATRQLTAAMSPEQAGRYGRLMDAVVKYAAAFTAGGVSADKAALVIARAVTGYPPYPLHHRPRRGPHGSGRKTRFSGRVMVDCVHVPSRGGGSGTC